MIRSSIDKPTILWYNETQIGDIMSEVKIMRLVTGEDVIAKIGENDQGISLNKPFVIIPQQLGPGKPVQLMMSLY